MADIVFPGQQPGGVIGREFLPANFDLELYKGDYLPFRLILRDSAGVPIDLTGYTARAQIRDYIDSTVVFEFALTITPTTGTIDVILNSPISSGLLPGSYIWDIQVTNPSGNTRTHIAGDVKVYDEVTRP